MCERLALAAGALAGKQAWRRSRLNDIAMFHVHEQISCIGHIRKSVKNYENWLTFRQSYCNNTKGDLFYWTIL